METVNTATQNPESAVSEQCAHLTLRFFPELQPDGSFKESWHCADCPERFTLRRNEVIVLGEAAEQVSSEICVVISLQHVVNVLNRALAEDRAPIIDLINYRVRCNEALADDPTIQVGRYTDSGCNVFPQDSRENTSFRVGVLGLLNGLFGTDERGGPLEAFYDDTGELKCFRVAHRIADQLAERRCL